MTIHGLFHASDDPHHPLVRAFLKSIEVGAARQGGVTLSPIEVRLVSISSADLVGAVNHLASTNVTARDLGLLLSGEPATTGGGVRESDDWTWDLTRYRPLQPFAVTRVTSVSCPAAGQCSAGGYYRDGAAHYQALVAGQVKGAWYPAIELPGLEALALGRLTFVASVSCASPGNCTVSGKYNASFGGTRPYVASQVKGKWYPAMDVPGSPALYAGTNESEILSISCGSAGNCAAGGYYTSGAGLGEAFLASEVNGKWGSAKEVPGSGTLNQGGDAAIDAVSCGSAGHCSASGYYETSSGSYQEFAVSAR